MKKQSLFALVAVVTSPLLLADDTLLKQRLNQLGATNVEITASPLPNFKTAITDQGILHISQDGQFMFQGDLYQFSQNRVLNITNRPLMSSLNALVPQMIVYPAKKEKYVITVFTDITCHYCQKLHSQINEYNDLGITVRYLAFPRQGLNSQAAKQMEGIWAADDKQLAMSRAKQGEGVQQPKSPEVIRAHYQLGVKFGVRGTPSIVTTSGELLPGYLSPKDLLETLEQF